MNDKRFPLARLAALTTCMLINSRLDAGEIREIVAFGASESVSVFTNGPTWIEYVATDLGVPIKNFATGAGGGTSSADAGQIRSYLRRNEPTPGTLFAAWHWGIGGDLLAGISASQAANGAIANLNTLVEAGASQFLIPNNYPLFPTIVPFLRDSANATAISANLDVARGLVEEGLRDLESLGEITLYRTDWDVPFQNVIQDPLEFGFTNVMDPVQGTEGNPDEYMWWDAIHWTTAMHRLVADNVLSSIAVPDPAILAGDYNGNDTVEQGDLDLVLLNWGADASAIPAAWVHDLPTGVIDQEELGGVLLHWGNQATALAAGSVPEPTGLVLAVLLVLWKILRPTARRVPCARS